VKYLHDLRIVHGDLKGVSISLKLNLYVSHLSIKANILVNKHRRACIADFGLVTIGDVVARTAAHSSQASLISNDSLMSFTAGGTYRWMSPELLYPEGFGIPESEGNRPTGQSDCYAFGMVIYEVSFRMHESVVANNH
jgi:serine/threonine protein kinase